MSRSRIVSAALAIGVVGEMHSTFRLMMSWIFITQHSPLPDLLHHEYQRSKICRMKITVAPKGMGLNDFVAQQEGFFEAEGVRVEFDWKTFRGTQSSWKGMEYFERPQDKTAKDAD